MSSRSSGVLTPGLAPNEPTHADPAKGRGGIALFMVIAAMSVLSILVTEFVYIAQVNQTLAFDGLDQLKAHYLAKSGLKLSLLRLKAYSQVKEYAKQLSGDASGKSGTSMVPRQLLDKIWSFPFFYPVPTNIPGLSMADKDKIDKFQKDSGLEGTFSAVIDSESSKYNLNQILAEFAAPQPSPSPTKSDTPGNPPPNPNPGASPTATPTPTPSFSPEEARASLQEYLAQLLNNKMESDVAFATEYRDFKLEDLTENIFSWADRGYERNASRPPDDIPFKRAPFYSLNELMMVPPMDDRLFDVFAPALTVSATPGIDINTMNETTLKALVPVMTAEEVEAFFKFRDNPDEDNSFRSEDDFFHYLTDNVAAYNKNQGAIDKMKGDFQKRHIRLVVDENQFKITVRAQVNQASRLIEAWVTLDPAKKEEPPGPGQPNPPNPPDQPSSDQNPGTPPPEPDPGLKITFMRIL